ncbi:MAG: caspase family protein [Thermodesulfobacteriota bacterium]|nr:caspase family protein [Thermodesulfobacteriota bacterium]
MEDPIYTTLYSNSRALIIGINQYIFAPPLEYAINDAKAVAEILKKKFGFDESNLKILTDKKASRSEIMAHYMTFVNKDIESNDRILIFFAGHGYTHTGKRGEVGFLVPNDGNISDLSSLIRWDDLTRNAELIPAKHILFIMDACYGGLAITRTLAPGSMRFLKDMLKRYARQVLTAGKANEVVSDSGGPIPNHSVFTGHLIEGLEGKAASDDGSITANGVMSYVYERVAKDPYSQQTPHYGFFDGDGDFIFTAPILSDLTNENEIDKDILISVPSSLPETSQSGNIDLIDITKQYLSDAKYKIRLHDLVSQKLREVISLLADEKFSIQGEGFNDDEFSRRLKVYEEVMKEIQSIIICVAFWGGSEHYQLLNKILARISDNLGPESGLIVYLRLRWYPLFLLLYSAGIASIANDNYNALSNILTVKVRSPKNIYEVIPISIPIGDAAAELHDAFKRLPGHKKHYVPRSEYLFKLLQPDLDDLLFLGNDYERYFDRFEVFLALVYADLTYKPEGSVWAPIGRFGWKYRNRSRAGNTYVEILQEAERFKNDWLPIKASLFSGSYGRFLEIATKYQELLNNSIW